MALIRTFAGVFAAFAIAAGLAGCASAPPGSMDEQFYFDKASGADVYQDTSQLRMRGFIGYPRTACCGPEPVLIEHP